MSEAPAWIVQYGALGLLGYVVWWLTRKLNGKVDAMTAHLRENTDAIRGLTATMERQNGPLRKPRR